MRKLLLSVVFVLGYAGAGASNYCGMVSSAIAVTIPQDNDSVAAKKRKGLIGRILAYLEDSNKEKAEKRFDFSIIGGPHYSSDSKLGLGIVATGLYRACRTDTLSPRSNVDVYGDVTTANYYKIGVRGNHVFPYDKCRIAYNVSFDYFKSYFWGIGYDMCNDNANKSEMDWCYVNAEIDLTWKIAGNIYIGPVIVYDYVCADDMEREELLNGMDHRSSSIGMGVSASYDSRDVLTNPHKGLYVKLSQCFRPSFLGNDHTVRTTSLYASAYGKAWRGAVIAGNATCVLNFGDPSWGMMAQLGSPYSMRGYYEGRYRDKHKIEAQVEVRQHLWGRNSMVMWGGAGVVFDKFSGVRAGHVLPNFGIGYRWEFKKDVNVRLDYGFGKSGQSGIIFNINEAF